MTLSDRRRSFQNLMNFSGPSGAVVGVAERTVPGPDNPIPVRIYTPEGISSGHAPGLVYFHGGGLVAGTIDTHDAFCRTLADTIDCRLISVDYRLAPEHRFPAAISDGYAAMTWALGHAEEFGIDPERVAIGGDSAGGTLAAVICQMIRHEGSRKPAYQL